MIAILSNTQAIGRAIAQWLILVSMICTPSVHANNALPYYDSPEFSPRWHTAGDPALDRFHKIPAFSFTNQLGARVSEQTVAGKIYVASFFFSTCPGICPAIHSKLVKVQDAYRDDDNVLILSHSIRPSTDTPQVLQRYASRNSVDSSKWHLLTGPKEAIYQLAKSAYFANEDLGNIQRLDEFLHTENLLLIDAQRRIRGVYNGLSASSVKHLINDIATLRQRTSP